MSWADFIQVLLGRFMYFLFPLTLGVCSILVMNQIAPALGIVDHPDGRKIHLGDIPVVGGIAMFFTVAVTSVMLTPHLEVLPLLFLCLLIVAMGTIDDLTDLNPKLRLMMQIGIAAVMIQYDGVLITSVGNIFGSGPVTMEGLAAILFTIVCIVGVINSVNMLDGIDGLAGSTILISFSAIAWLAWHGDQWVIAKQLTIFVGALVAFLIFNARIFFKSAQIFMGDAGSMMLGLMLVMSLVKTTQGDAASISPIIAGWIFGVPLIDTISVMVRRIQRGRSPIVADRDHIHHQLLDIGWSVNRTVITLCLVQVLLVCIAVFTNDHPLLHTFMFWVFVLIVLSHHLVTPRILSRSQQLDKVNG